MHATASEQRHAAVVVAVRCVFDRDTGITEGDDAGACLPPGGLVFGEA